MSTCNIHSICWRSGFRRERILLLGTVVVSLVIPSIHHHYYTCNIHKGHNLIFRDSCGRLYLHYYIVTMSTCNIHRSGSRTEVVSLSGTAVVSLSLLHHHHVHMQHPFIRWRSAFRREIISLLGTAVVSLGEET